MCAPELPRLCCPPAQHACCAGSVPPLSKQVLSRAQVTQAGCSGRESCAGPCRRCGLGSHHAAGAADSALAAQPGAPREELHPAAALRHRSAAHQCAANPCTCNTLNGLLPAALLTAPVRHGSLTVPASMAGCSMAASPMIGQQGQSVPACVQAPMEGSAALAYRPRSGLCAQTQGPAGPSPPGCRGSAWRNA